MKRILLLAVIISAVYANPNLREEGQEKAASGEVGVGQNQSGIYPPGLVVQQSPAEFIPTHWVVYRNLPRDSVTSVNVTTTTTTQAPPPDQDDSSEEEEDDEADEESGTAAAGMNKGMSVKPQESTLIPGYISPSGELLVPISTFQLDKQGRKSAQTPNSVLNQPGSQMYATIRSQRNPGSQINPGPQVNPNPNVGMDPRYPINPGLGIDARYLTNPGSRINPDPNVGMDPRPRYPINPGLEIYARYPINPGLEIDPRFLINPGFQSHPGSQQINPGSQINPVIRIYPGYQINPGFGINTGSQVNHGFGINTGSQVDPGQEIYPRDPEITIDTGYQTNPLPQTGGGFLRIDPAFKINAGSRYLSLDSSKVSIILKFNRQRILERFSGFTGLNFFVA